MNIGFLIALQFKHYVADYLLQNEYMQKKGAKTGWLKPLMLHSGIHGFLTFLIVPIFNQSIYVGLTIALIDFLSHCIIDRAKTKVKTDLKTFWYVLGTDQLLHNLVYILLEVII